MSCFPSKQKMAFTVYDNVLIIYVVHIILDHNEKFLFFSHSYQILLQQEDKAIQLGETIGIDVTY